ncbi:glutamate 5-kinase [Yunchengibacter salinarum]|uniref:glutamate 5-kinase n=1 Tax=Yunchengibacter salinarum TaxID=3133399 RepID=UPI0035B62705
MTQSPAQTADNAAARLAAARRVVVKIGSALLVDPETGLPRTDWARALADDIAAMVKGGQKVVLVSSGAIALGRRALGLTGRVVRLEQAQAAASVGQVLLAELYRAELARHGLDTGQLLLTLGDLEDRPRYLNARNTLGELMERDIVPVINENDTVATSEIRFGDNDRLAARVAALAEADCTLLLSDVDGLYTAPPGTPGARHLPVVPQVTQDVRAMAGPPEAMGVGTGGMVTKLAAADLAMAAGSSLIITDGTAAHPVQRLLDGGRATLFPAAESPLAVRKAWIRGMMSPRGFLHVDKGAAAALRRGASLLPAGVTSVEGGFHRGDLVAFMGDDGHLVGQGLIAYSASETARIQGARMADLHGLLGYMGRSALVHRDDLVVF